MVRIFLAHAKEDKAQVFELYDRLKQQGYRPWLDKKDLRGGQNWRLEIAKAIKDSDVFIACLSQTSVGKRGYVQKEFKMALNKYSEMPPGAVYLIPLRLDDCDIPELRQEEYGVNLRDIHWIDFFESDGFEQLVASIDYAFPDAVKDVAVTDVETIKPQAKTIAIGNGVSLELAYIPGGTFQMGSLANEKGSYAAEQPQHKVTVPAFWMGKYLVTQEQYQAVVGNNPSYFKENGNKLPVENVSWYDATSFCEEVSQQTGERIKLPSEAEWEYACRAGTTTPFYFGDSLSKAQANHDGDVNKTTPVGAYPANTFGLYDMHGNVYEWCQDHWHKNYEGAPTDSSAWIEGGDSEHRVVRGGSWYINPRYCRSAFRGFNTPVFRFNAFGFRVVCSAPRAPQA